MKYFRNYASNTFNEISKEIIKQMDYIVPEKYADSTDYNPHVL